MFCKEQAAQLRGIKKELEAAGARLVFIGNGNTASARDFKATLMPDCEVLTDPSTASYALLGARRGAWAVWSPRSWPAGLRAILDSGGAVRWTYVSRYAGDHPHTAQVLAAVKQAVRG